MLEVRMCLSIQEKTYCCNGAPSQKKKKNFFSLTVQFWLKAKLPGDNPISQHAAGFPERSCSSMSHHPKIPELQSLAEHSPDPYSRKIVQIYTKN